MAAWFGFSDDDLKKVKNMGKPNNENPQKKLVNPPKKGNLGPAKKPAHIRPNVPGKQNNAEVDPSMKLQKPANKSGGNEGFSRKIPRDNTRQQRHVNQEPVDDFPSVEKQTHSNHDGGGDTPAESLDDKEGYDRDLMSLEKFREQQKAIEEANKQKKALLSKTITERKKKAKAEAHKLEHIQRELSKLDHLLTLDVQVIRNKIEDISRDYMEAEKRFQRAEVEYIAAKVDMHEKSEQKEQLTEHMYTIIHQNEVRKARKLAELMREMEMEGGVEEDLHLPELPPLSSFQPNTLPTSPTAVKHIVKQPDTVKSESNNTNDKVKTDISADTEKSGTCETNSEKDNTKTTNIEKSDTGTNVIQGGDNKCTDSGITNSEPIAQVLTETATSDVKRGLDEVKDKSDTDKQASDSQNAMKKKAADSDGDSNHPPVVPINDSEETDKQTLPCGKDTVEQSQQHKEVPKIKWDFDGNIS